VHGAATGEEARRTLREEVMRAGTEIAPMLQNLLDTESWTLFSAFPDFDVKTFTRPEAGRVAVKVTGVIPHHIRHCLAPLLFPDRLDTWLPGVVAASHLCQPSIYRQLIYMACMKLPLFSPRDLVMEGYGDIHEGPDGSSVMIYLRSVDSDEYVPETAGVNARSREQGFVRAENVVGMLFTPRGDSATELSCKMSMDLKLAWMPKWVMDYTSKHFAKDLVPMLAWQAKGFAEQGEDLMDTKPATFAEMDRRLAASPHLASAETPVCDVRTAIMAGMHGAAVAPGGASCSQPQRATTGGECRDPRDLLGTPQRAQY
jgi:hypothetical protein